MEGQEREACWVTRRGVWGSSVQRAGEGEVSTGQVEPGHEALCSGAAVPGWLENQRGVY